MTYSGFKSLIYAGLTKDDPRVKAALDWIQKNYTVKKNPGQGDAGLFYYYHAFAAALDASKLEAITNADGSHNWRDDLTTELAERQNPDGSWTNSNRQWFENDANLATSFALIALSYCDNAPAKP
jgi:squalene-hopene/tetraprenyl-beta-curcumene cyclase